MILSKDMQRQRGSMLLEAMVAVVILTIAFLAWSGSMMGASQGQNHAAKHTESIMIANYLFEQIRRDPEFWAGTGFGGEFLGVGSCSGGNCWVQANPKEKDYCGNNWPAYADAGPGVGTWTTGCQNLDDQTGGAQAMAHSTYQFQWRADVHGLGKAWEDDQAADVTVWVQTQSLHGGWDLYKVTGTIRAPRQ